MKMRYTEFVHMLDNYLTGYQIDLLKRKAYQFYQDAHGYKPLRKEQKQVAYGFIKDLLYNMKIDECIEFMEKIGVPAYKATELWQSLEWIRGN